MGAFSEFLAGAIVKKKDPLSENSKDDIKKFASSGTSKTTQNPAPSSDQATGSNNRSASIEIDPEYAQHLLDFIEGKNFPGPDYFEFSQVLQEIENDNPEMPESQRYKVAYVGFKTQKIAPEVFLNTGNKYITLLKQHKGEFDNFIAGETTENVGAKEEENRNLLSSNVDAGKKISQLEKQIEDLRSQVARNEGLIESNKELIDGEHQKILKKKENFQAAFDFFTGKIKNDLEKISSYLISPSKSKK